MANRVRTERLEIKLTKEEKELISKAFMLNLHSLTRDETIYLWR